MRQFLFVCRVNRITLTNAFTWMLAKHGTVAHKKRPKFCSDVVLLSNRIHTKRNNKKYFKEQLLLNSIKKL